MLDPVETQKKPYETPELLSWGNIQEVTQQGGGAFVDVPMGSPNTGISGITGNLS